MTVEQDIDKLRLRLDAVEAQRKLEDNQRKELSVTTAMSRDLVDMGLTPCASVRQNVAQTVTTNTWTKITMDTLIFDFMGNSVIIATDRIIVRRGGIYLVIGGVQWVANATGARAASIYVNGALVEGSGRYGATITTTVLHAPAAMAILKVNVNDYFELFGLQVSGGDLDTSVAAPRSFLSAILLSKGN